MFIANEEIERKKKLTKGREFSGVVSKFYLLVRYGKYNCSFRVNCISFVKIFLFSVLILKKYFQWSFSKLHKGLLWLVDKKLVDFDIFGSWDISWFMIQFEDK